MKRTYVLLTGILILLLASCVTTPTVPTPPPGGGGTSLDTRRWAGDWEEDWPGSQVRDRYRITISADGNTISVKPITREDRQNLSNLRWDGETLSFTLYFDNSPINYSLRIDAAGNNLTGTATRNGEPRNIRWYRAGTGGGAVGGGMALPAADWTGLWEEDWPSSNSPQDVYQIVVSGSRAQVNPQSNQGVQQISNVNWSPSQLTFNLHYREVNYTYTLRPTSRNVLAGTAVSTEGQSYNITWRRKTGGAVVPPSGMSLSAAEWTGLWEEDWPSSDSPQDMYQIAVSGNSAQVYPQSNEGVQQVSNVSWSPSLLSFRLHYREVNYTYTLRPTSRNVLTGTAVSDEGRQYNVTWRKKSDGAVMPQGGTALSAAEWSGYWEEDWPSSNSPQDIYQIIVSGGRAQVYPQSNEGVQQVSNVSWSPSLLTFNLHYREVDYTYTLRPNGAGVLTGQAVSTSGQQYNITWHKRGGAAVLPIGNWDGMWEEDWPNRTERDQYRLTTYNGQLQVQPLTNTDRQRVDQVRVNGQYLSFVLFFGDNRIEYSLTMVDGNTATGTVALSSGNRLNVTWHRIR